MSYTPRHLSELLEQGACSGSGVTFIDAGAGERVTWANLHDDACRYAQVLQSADIGPGSRVAIVGPSSRAVATMIQAVWLCGATLTVLAAPSGNLPTTHTALEFATRLRACAPDLVVADGASWQLVHGLNVPVQVLSTESIQGRANTLRAGAFCADAFSEQSAALVQYTSGSSSDPRGVVISRLQLAEHVVSIKRRVRAETDDETVVSWLPLFHDMGLIGFFCVPMMLGLDLVLADPSDFARSPKSWMELVAGFSATMTGAPSFAFGLAARGLAVQSRLDLSRLRLAFNGAEPIDPAVIDAFVAAGERHGMDGRAVFCVYGMAEATLAISLPTPGTGMEVDTVDPAELEAAGLAQPHARGRRLVKLGTPLDGTEIRILDHRTSERVPERHVGEITVRGPSITKGYFDAPDVSEHSFNGDWLRTGDLGYLADDQIVVCGRVKDVIIVGGRNIHPQDVERVASTIRGVRTGNVIAFGSSLGSREGVVVVAESRPDAPAALRTDVSSAVQEVFGLKPRDVVLMRPGTLPKTSSGKVRRAECKALYQAGRLESPDSGSTGEIGQL